MKWTRRKRTKQPAPLEGPERFTMRCRHKATGVIYKATFVAHVGWLRAEAAECLPVGAQSHYAMTVAEFHETYESVGRRPDHLKVTCATCQHSKIDGNRWVCTARIARTVTRIDHVTGKAEYRACPRCEVVNDGGDCLDHEPIPARRTRKKATKKRTKEK